MYKEKSTLYRYTVSRFRNIFKFYVIRVVGGGLSYNLFNVNIIIEDPCLGKPKMNITVC